MKRLLIDETGEETHAACRVYVIRVPDDFTDDDVEKYKEQIRAAAEAQGIDWQQSGGIVKRETFMGVVDDPGYWEGDDDPDEDVVFIPPEGNTNDAGH